MTIRQHADSFDPTSNPENATPEVDSERSSPGSGHQPMDDEGCVFWGDELLELP